MLTSQPTPDPGERIIKAPGGPYPGVFIRNHFKELCRQSADRYRAFFLETDEDTGEIFTIEATALDVIAALTRLHGMIITEVCERANVRYPTVYRWINYGSKPSDRSREKLVRLLQEVMTQDRTRRALRITDIETLEEIYLRALAMLGVECTGAAAHAYTVEAAARGGWGLELTAAVAVTLAMPPEAGKGFRIAYQSAESIGIQPITAPASREAVNYCAQEYQLWANEFSA